MQMKDLDLSQNISKQKLLDVLKSEADNVNVRDIMVACSHLKEESKYVPAGYREEYDRIYIEFFLLGIKKMREDKNSYPGLVEVGELKNAIKTLNIQQNEVEQDSKEHLVFFKIYKLITLYTTFVLDEPVHPVGMPFPGGFKIKYEDGIFYCPVKKSQKDNPGAVCGICIAEQDKDV